MAVYWLVARPTMINSSLIHGIMSRVCVRDHIESSHYPPTKLPSPPSLDL